jgi:hypothetical protein
MFIIVEKNKKGKLHFHAIVAIRNFIDYNKIIQYNIKQAINIGLTDELKFTINLDTRVNCLRYFKDIKNWVMYMHKDYENYIFKGGIYSIQKYILCLFQQNLGDIYGYYLKPYDNIIFQNNIWLDFSHCDETSENEFEIEYHEKEYLKERFNINMDINGVSLDKNTLNQETLIDLVRYYLVLNEYYLYNKNVYKKVKGSKISFKYLGTIQEVLYTNFTKNIITFYITNFKYYFKGLDFSGLTRDYLIKNKKYIESV